MRARPLTRADEVAIAGWSYDGPDAVYDPADGVTAALGFETLVDARGALVGYACVGPEARVPGAHEELVSSTSGWGCAPEATTARAFVLDWNARSRATLRRAGFDEIGELVTDDGRTFVVAERALP